MKITVTENMFVNLFSEYDAADRFSREGLAALFEHLDSSGDDLELDIIGLCCDYAEEGYDYIAASYSLESASFEEVVEYLERNTIVIHSNWLTGLIMYQSF